MSATKSPLKGTVDSSGQVLLEFLGALLLLVPLGFAMGSLLWAEWQKARCVVQVFELAHARRIGATPRNRGAPNLLRVTSGIEGIQVDGHCGRAQEQVTLPWLERGSLSVPMLLGLLAISSFFMGNFLLLRDARLQVERQLRLDRCTGDAALALKERVQRVEASVTRFRALRISAAVTTLLPAAKAAAQAALEAEYLWQESIRLGWEAAEARWWLHPSCGESGALPSLLAYPAFPWKRDPPDSIGPGELRRAQIETQADEFRLEARAKARASAAIVTHRNKSWSAAWAAPRG